LLYLQPSHVNDCNITLLINWKNTPLIRLVIPLLVGILTAIYLNFQSLYWVSSFGIGFLALVAMYFFSKKNITYLKEILFGGILNAVLILGGVSLIVLHTSSFKASHYSKFSNADSQYVMSVIEVPKNKPNSIQVIGEVQQVVNGDTSVVSSGLSLFYFRKDSLAMQILQGDVLQVDCELKSIQGIKNPGQFNYKNYLRFNQIYEQAFVGADNWSKLETGNVSLVSFASKIRDRLLSVLEENGLSGNEMAVASALILGYKDDLDSDLKHSYSSAGATHVLAVSGLHVGIIFLVVSFLLKFMDRSQRLKYLKVTILLIVLWFYALITGLSPSVVRAATMFSFVAVGGVFNRKAIIYNTLASSAFVLLCINPYLIMEVGFQLSYLAVLGIVYFQPKIYKLIYMPYKSVDYVWQITSVSLAAQLTTFPLGLLYFHQFPNYFFISNLVVIPGAFAIMFIGILLFVSSPFPIVSIVVGKLLSGLVFMMNWVVTQIDALPYSLLEGVSISILECWMLYLMLVFFVSGMEFKKLKYFNFSLVLFIALFVVDINEDLNLASHRELVIFDIKDEPNFNFINGKQHYFYGQPSLWADESTMLFNVEHYWGSHDLNAPDTNFLSNDLSSECLLSSDGVFSFNNYSFYYATEVDSLQKVHHLDFFYTESSFVPDEIDCKQLIIGKAVSFWARNEYLDYAHLHGIAVHDLNVDGAFQFVFE